MKRNSEVLIDHLSDWWIIYLLAIAVIAFCVLRYQRVEVFMQDCVSVRSHHDCRAMSWRVFVRGRSPIELPRKPA